MRFVGDIALDAEVRAIASGAITDGAPVAVNSTGTVSQVTETAASLGTEGAFNSITSAFMSSVFDSSNNKHIIVYRTSSNMRYVVATVASDGGVTFGTDAVVKSGDYQQISATFDSTNNRIVVVYSNGASYAIVGSLSGTTVTWGSETEYHSTAGPQKSISFDSTAGKVVIVYRGASNYGRARVGTVSGTSISFGTEVVFKSGTISDPRTAYDSTNNKTVVLYGDGSDSTAKGKSIVGTVSGTDISFGSAVEFEEGAIKYPGIAFDNDTGKVVIAYRQNHETSGSTDFKRGTAVVGTVSGTSISFGSTVAFDNTGDYGESLSDPVIYDSNAKKILVVYPRTLSGSYSNRGFVFPLTVSGTTVVADTPTDFAGASTSYPAISFDSNVNKNLISFVDAGNSEYGTAVSFAPLSGNITSENFIGFANAAYADGQKATVKTTGSIARNIPQLEAASSSLGSETVYASVTARYPNAVFDSSNNRVVIGYTDGSNSNYGTAVVGSVSGTSISFGTPVVFESASIGASFYAPDLAFDSNSNKVVIVYPDGGNSTYPTAIVGTVDPSDNSISFGTAATIQTSGAASVDMSIAFDSNSNKVLVIYSDAGNSNYTTGAVGTVSGTNISFGTKAVVYSANGSYSSVVFDSNANKFAVFYRDVSNGHGRCKVATISGTDVTYGSEATYASASSSYPQSTFDSSNNKIVLAFEDDANSDYATAIVGTISGTDITFGTEAVINQGPIQNIFNHSITFATGINKVIHFTKDGIDGDHGKVHIGTVSGTGISFGSTILINGGDALLGVTATFDSNLKKAVLAFMDEGNSNYGTAVVLTPAGTLEDLTIGQQYFVQTDGSLGTSADDPSVIAGTAIGTSDIIVKG